ncbi:hypothetical protein, partial [Mesorhizobium sp. M7A.F.Ca.US.001.04.1.1]|uniref:hypothetical protein n=1 Tax=Mesorhizobium sp. M7A.F.Ca.US.001.04.1.1 TaxID=2496726 RepID=UPI0019D10618
PYSPTARSLPTDVEQAQPAKLLVHCASDITAHAADIAQLAVGEILDVLVGSIAAGRRIATRA